MAAGKPVSFSLTLIRHAETSANKANILQGQQDVDLSLEGENQIKLLGAWLSREAYAVHTCLHQLPLVMSPMFVGQQDVDLSLEGENQIKLLGAWLSREAYTHAYTSQQDVDLSLEGENQIKLLGAWLSREAYTHAYTSDLLRCKKTAEAIVQGNTVYRPLIKHDERLRERCFGVLEGKPAKMFVQQQNACHLPNKTMFTPENGESLEDMTSRVVAFFRDICAMVTKISTTKQQHLDDKQQHLDDKQRQTTLLPNLSTTHRSDENGHHGSLHEHSHVPDKLKGLSASNLPRTKLSSTITVVRSLIPSSNQGSPRPSSSEFNTIRPGKTWKSYKDDTIADILVVSHGGVIRVFLTYFLDVIKCSIGEFQMDKVLKITPNTAATRVVVFIYPDRPPNATIVSLHDTGHLQAPGSSS